MAVPFQGKIAASVWHLHYHEPPKSKPAAPPKKGKRRRRRKRRPPRQVLPVIDYAERAAAVKRLGFSSYQAYLDSPLWAEIRQRVLLRDRGECRTCGRPAVQVHHAQYDEATLAGAILRHLAAICSGCHRRVEFSGDTKRDGKAAGAEYARRRRGQKAAKFFSGDMGRRLDKEFIGALERDG